MKKPDGGPAFPHPSYATSNYSNTPTWSIETVGGMSLRDYFAGQALIGVIAAAHLGPLKAGNWLTLYEQVSAHAYGIADAMIAEREKDRGL